jgi:hypothetical protein
MSFIARQEELLDQMSEYLDLVTNPSNGVLEFIHEYQAVVPHGIKAPRSMHQYANHSLTIRSILWSTKGQANLLVFCNERPFVDYMQSLNELQQNMRQLYQACEPIEIRNDF